MSHEEKPKQYFLNRYTCEFHIGRLSDDDIHVIEHSAYQALLEIIKIQSKSLKYYANESFDSVCFLDHATCEEEYGKDAREALSKTDDALKGLGL